MHRREVWDIIAERRPFGPPENRSTGKTRCFALKGSLSAAEVHKQYSDGVSAFRRQISDAALRQQFTREVDVFMRACALGVWGRDGAAITPRHVEYYNAIYTKGNPVPSILFWELSTAVSEYPGFKPPACFVRMRACDKVSGGSLATGI